MNTGINGVFYSVLRVCNGVRDWLVDMLSDLTTMFYQNGSLTVIGILAVCGLGFSVIFLLIGLIQRFLHFRG